jgi:hypothetical protein
LFRITKEVLAAVRPEKKQPFKMSYEMMASFLNFFQQVQN